MPSRPANITTLQGSEGLHVINQLFREITGRLDDIEKSVAPRTFLKATGTLVFGTIPAQSAIEATLYVGGANGTGSVHVSPAQGLSPGNPNLMWSGRVSHQNQVAVKVLNPTGAPIAVNTIKWNIGVVQ